MKFQVEQQCRRKRTHREVIGTLELAEKSSLFPHHQYVQKLLSFRISLKEPLMPVDSSSTGDQESAPKKRRLDLDLSDEEFERIRSKIVIRDPERETEKKKKKKNCTNADESKTEKKAAKKKKCHVFVNLPDPELSKSLRARMAEKAQEFGEADVERVVLVIQKVLQMSDITRQQNRLTIPKKQAKEAFLRPDQEQYLSERDGCHTNYMAVPIIEPTGGVSHLALRRWNVGKTSVLYILNGGWKDVVSLNRLEEGQIVQVWAFWIKGNLNLAFVFSGKTPKEEASTSQAIGVVHPVAPLLLTYHADAEAATATETGTGSSGSEDSNLQSVGLDFDLNMIPDEY